MSVMRVAYKIRLMYRPRNPHGGLLLLALAGLVIAIAGALGPAAWAARTRTAAVLHTE